MPTNLLNISLSDPPDEEDTGQRTSKDMPTNLLNISLSDPPDEEDTGQRTSKDVPTNPRALEYLV
ncbi:MAG: hypothetical protein OEU36_25770, partial [Gammaproteobacteria bacterium]|nr:hypothetical protein [Gammaproteobacteria bacterium]